MNETVFKDRTKKIMEVNDVLKALDSSIRPVAFELLKDYITSGRLLGQKGDNDPIVSDAVINEINPNQLFDKYDHKKPADNAKLVAAFHFSKYGSSPFSIEEIQNIAKDAGVTLPGRLDMTLLNAKKKGKNLFRRAGRGMFKPTVHGENFLKEFYHIRKGTDSKEEENK